MTHRSSRFILLAVTAVSLSAYSFAYGRGGGHGGGYEHANSRPDESRAQAEDRRGPEANSQANEQNSAQSNRGEDMGRDEALRHTVDNPFVRGAEANRALDREGYYGYRNPYYWGWGGIGGGDWTTSNPPPTAPNTP